VHLWLPNAVRSRLHSTSRASISHIMSNIVPLKRCRGMIKTSCTRMETFISGVRDLTAETRAQLEERRVRLDTLWNDYCDIQIQIEMIDDEELRNRIAFEDSFYSLCAKFRQRLQSGFSNTGTRAASTQGVRIIPTRCLIYVYLN